MRSIVTTLTAWGPAGVLLLAGMDSAGVPLPAGVDALLVYLSAQNPSQAYLCALLATIGSLAGNLFLFFLARRGGQIYLDKHTLSGRGVKFRAWFQHYGLLTVFIPALLPIPMPMKLFVLCAGGLGISPGAFIAVLLAARIPRFFGLAWLGMQMKDNALDYIKAHVLHLLGAAAVLFLVLFLMIKAVDAFRARRHA